MSLYLSRYVVVDAINMYLKSNSLGDGILVKDIHMENGDVVCETQKTRTWQEIAKEAIGNIQGENTKKV